MSDEITKDRSPRSPSITLEDALNLTKKLHAQARTAALKPDNAARALGYSGLTGASLGVLASLGQYGLIDRTGGNVSVSSLAVKILHPRDEAQRLAAVREAAMPKVFLDILKGFEDCSADVITNHLIQEKFTPDRARKVAHVFIANRKFAKLDEIVNSEDNSFNTPPPDALPENPSHQPQGRTAR